MLMTGLSSTREFIAVGVGPLLARALFGGACVLLVSCGHAQTTMDHPMKATLSRTPAPVTASPRPTLTTATVPLATPPPVHASGTASPSATPVPAPKASAVIAPPDAPPRILSVQMGSVVHSGQKVSGSVVTSSNVASVEARVGGYAATTVKTGVGAFALSYQLPDLPFFFKGRAYSVRIIARNARGDATERDVQVILQ